MCLARDCIWSAASYLGNPAIIGNEISIRPETLRHHLSVILPLAHD